MLIVDQSVVRARAITLKSTSKRARARRVLNIELFNGREEGRLRLEGGLLTANPCELLSSHYRALYYHHLVYIFFFFTSCAYKKSPFVRFIYVIYVLYPFDGWFEFWISLFFFYRLLLPSQVCFTRFRVLVQWWCYARFYICLILIFVIYLRDFR